MFLVAKNLLLVTIAPMRALIQRVRQAEVTIGAETVASIGPGLLIFLGVHSRDQPEMTQWLVQKIINLRLFSDSEGKMNRSLLEVGGEALVVSQFTLYGNCLNGRRPDFIDSAPPAIAEKLYEKFVLELKKELAGVQTGRFGAYMQVSLINDGPVTFLVER